MIIDKHRDYYFFKQYMSEIESAFAYYDISFLENKKIVISGATGAIMSEFIDSILIHKEINCVIFVLTRNVSKAKKRFSYFQNDERLIIKEANILEDIDISDKIDYVVHAASITSPNGYANYPTETMDLNYIGTKRMASLAVKNNAKMLLLSSTEIYGISENDTFSENDYGYNDPLISRNCYNISKLAAESLLVSYSKEFSLRFVIARLSRSIGLTTNLSNDNALTQFIYRAITGQDIILKSSGLQKYSYLYIKDAVVGLLYLLHYGESSAYNIASNPLSLKEITNILENAFGVKTISGSDEYSGFGYSKITTSILNCDKISQIGWKPEFSSKDAILVSAKFLKEIYKQDE